MNPETTKLIEQYLSNELSATEKISFEKKLAESSSLQKEVKLQQRIHDAAKRAATRVQIRQIGKSYHFYRNLLATGIVITAIIIVSVLAFYIYSSFNKEKKFSESPEVKSLVEQLKENSPIDNLASEFFYWEGKDSIILSKEGVLLSVPSNAFLLNGLPYSDKAIIQWQEAMDGATIVKSGLSTIAGDRLLETQGMFGIQAYTKDGKKLTVNPNVGIYIQAPVDQYKDGIQLFSGKKGKEGIINWVNPTPLMKIPVPIDMKELDFYPNRYEGTLDELKMSSAKKYRDSLYLSFDEEDCNSGNQEIVAVEPSSYSNEIAKSKPAPVGQSNTPLKKDKKNNQFYEHHENSSDKVYWSYEVRKIDKKHAVIILKADLNEDCQLSTLKDFKNSKISNYINTEILLENSPQFKKTSDLRSYMNYEIYNPTSKSRIYKDNVVRFIQQIEILDDKPFTIYVKKKFTVCSKGKNIEPATLNDEIFIKGFSELDQTDESNFKSNFLNQYISPTKVISFWQPAFNNTLLATREFERRMRTIHTTCDNKVLDLYTSNLYKSMKEIDEMAVSLGHPEFAEFAKEQVGSLNLSNPHLRGLQKFYENETKKLQRIVQLNRGYKIRKKNEWDKDLQKNREKEQNRTIDREYRALNEEYNINLKNVSKQLGKTVGFQIHGGGTVYNIDKYVMDATISRTSTLITDSETEKTAKITYNPFSFEVKNSDQFKNLYTYLFPTLLNSYQRISSVNGKFDYPLNSDIHYDLCIIGISDKGFFYKEVRNLCYGNIGLLELSDIPEKELDNKIKMLNEARGILKPIPIGSEISWLKKEQKNYIRQKKRRNDAEFRTKIKQVIFPCMGAGEYLPKPVSDTTAVSTENLFGI